MQNVTFLCYNVVQEQFLTQKTQQFHEKKNTIKKTRNIQPKNSGIE